MIYIYIYFKKVWQINKKILLIGLSGMNYYVVSGLLEANLLKLLFGK